MTYTTATVAGLLLANRCQDTTCHNDHGYVTGFGCVHWSRSGSWLDSEGGSDE